MTKEYLENILTEYGVAFTDSLADRLLKEFEPCENAISRESAINAVSNALKRTFVENEDLARKIINKLPPVTPQPKTGRWIMHERLRECSWCGVFLMKDMPRNSYCPNCGTRMIESQERSDNK